MSNWGLSARQAVGTAFTALGLLLPTSGSAADKTASSGQPPASGTNAIAPEFTPPAPRKDGLQQLEEQLSRSLQGIRPKGGLEGLMSPRIKTPAPRVVVPNKRTQELIDRQKNWILSKPDDLSKPDTLKELFNLRDYDVEGKDQSEASSLERLYESLSREKGKPLREDPTFEELYQAALLATKREPEKAPAEKVPEAIKEREEALRKMLDRPKEPGMFDWTPDKGDSPEIFGLGLGLNELPEKQAPNPYLEQFKELLSAPGFATSANNFDPINPTVGNIGVLPTDQLSTPELKPLDVTAQPFEMPGGTVKPLQAPTATPDFNRQVLNQWNPFYSAPTIEPRRVSPPTAPVRAPRRGF